jgi:hypothetical protein
MKVLYAVLKLSKNVTINDPFTGKEHTEKINGIAGFIPCFERLEDAEEEACDGKFEIFLIKEK